jgi:hypothetical protein
MRHGVARLGCPSPLGGAKLPAVGTNFSRLTGTSPRSFPLHGKPDRRHPAPSSSGVVARGGLSRRHASCPTYGVRPPGGQAGGSLVCSRGGSRCRRGIVPRIWRAVPLPLPILAALVVLSPRCRSGSAAGVSAPPLLASCSLAPRRGVCGRSLGWPARLARPSLRSSLAPLAGLPRSLPRARLLLARSGRLRRPSPAPRASVCGVRWRAPPSCRCGRAKPSCPALVALALAAPVVRSVRPPGCSVCPTIENPSSRGGGLTEPRSRGWLRITGVRTPVPAPSGRSLLPEWFPSCPRVSARKGVDTASPGRV